MDTRNDAQLAVQAYELINRKANSNTVIQGLTGVVGFPFTIIADGAVIFTHYKPLLDEIRMLYGRLPVAESAVKPLFNSLSSEVLFDLVADKLLGQIPLLGIYFNAICAKTMTWRLGLLFAMLAEKGEEINEADAVAAMQRIREAFPQNDTFKFKQPEYAAFRDLVLT